MLNLTLCGGGEPNAQDKFTFHHQALLVKGPGSVASPSRPCAGGLAGLRCWVPWVGELSPG